MEPPGERCSVRESAHGQASGTSFETNIHQYVQSLSSSPHPILFFLLWAGQTNVSVTMHTAGCMYVLSSSPLGPHPLSFHAFGRRRVFGVCMYGLSRATSQTQKPATYSPTHLTRYPPTVPLVSWLGAVPHHNAWITFYEEPFRGCRLSPRQNTTAHCAARRRRAGFTAAAAAAAAAPPTDARVQRTARRRGTNSGDSQRESKNLGRPVRCRRIGNDSDPEPRRVWQWREREIPLEEVLRTSHILNSKPQGTTMMAGGKMCAAQTTLLDTESKMPGRKPLSIRMQGAGQNPSSPIGSLGVDLKSCFKVVPATMSRPSVLDAPAACPIASY
ncbi:hypothetical protein BKA81DRAFT_379371 [Phyllosticta paracitricarpa]